MRKRTARDLSVARTTLLVRAELIALALIAACASLYAACGDGDGDNSGATQGAQTGSAGGSATASINPADFSATIDNRFFPLEAEQKRTYEGEETNGSATTKTRVEETVLGETDKIAGVEVRIVEAKEYEDGELTEVTRDYYAQHKDGAVYYFGERVDEYSGGQVTGHGGQWLAGEGQNQPGVFMPADPKVGDQFQQERAPGIAEDTSKVIVIGEMVDVPAVTAGGCIKTEDYSPIDKVTEYKFYCPDIGLMREEFTGGSLDLVSIEPPP